MLSSEQYRPSDVEGISYFARYAIQYYFVAWKIFTGDYRVCSKSFPLEKESFYENVALFSEYWNFLYSNQILKLIKDLIYLNTKSLIKPYLTFFNLNKYNSAWLKEK